MKKSIIISCTIFCLIVCFVMYIFHKPPVYLTPVNEDYMTWTVLGRFDSFDKIQDFVDLVYSEPEGSAYQQYMRCNYHLAEKAAANISSTMLPCVKDGKNVDYFCAEYFFNENKNKHILHMDYIIDDVRYYFKIAFDGGDFNPDGNKCLTGQAIGPTVVDLYEKNGNLYGAFQVQSVPFGISISTKGVGDVNLEQFVFASITKNLNPV